MTTDYEQYRGKCKEYCEIAIKNDPTLTIIRGYYYCPVWDREEQHWWTKMANGSTYDPTSNQFPSRGAGIYTEFDGNITCEECGLTVQEEHATMVGRFPCCSNNCAMKLVGL